MKVLAVASEVFPLVKTGGLADVAGALPGALKPYGIAMRCLVPGYPAVLAAINKPRAVQTYDNLFGGPARVVEGMAGGLDLLVIEAPHLYTRPGNPYVGADGVDWPDNWQRFAALSFVAGEFGRGAIASFVPDLVHAHDWQTGLAPAYLHFAGSAAPSLMTVHNLAFQGRFLPTVFAGLGLPAAAFAVSGVEYYGGVGYLKSGLAYADAISTVSPSYADEICTPEGGMGLDGLLRQRRDDLTGIVNGIDAEIWNPATDADLVSKYDDRSLAARDANKRAIEGRFSLDEGDGPILCVVSRLTWQKGMDILATCLDDIVASGIRLALLGSGDAAIEMTFRHASERHPGRIGVIIGYDESLSHLLQGGADAIVIPSRFEPCGLTQLYGLRYGCVPVVARTGGLADTIVDANDAALTGGSATGFQFASPDATLLMNCLRRVNRVFADKAAWQSIQRRGMQSDVSWKRSAARYAALYKNIVSNRAAA
ncbi:glycogen synthase GlgA [soil metagenome]